MKERLIALLESGKIQDYIKDNREILLKVAAAALLIAAAFFVFVFTGDEEDYDVFSYPRKTARSVIEIAKRYNKEVKVTEVKKEEGKTGSTKE